jgi:hypothetical protein
MSSKDQKDDTENKEKETAAPLNAQYRTMKKFPFITEPRKPRRPDMSTYRFAIVSCAQHRNANYAYMSSALERMYTSRVAKPDKTWKIPHINITGNQDLPLKSLRHFDAIVLVSLQAKPSQALCNSLASYIEGGGALLTLPLTGATQPDYGLSGRLLGYAPVEVEKQLNRNVGANQFKFGGFNGNSQQIPLPEDAKSRNHAVFAGLKSVVLTALGLVAEDHKDQKNVTTLLRHNETPYLAFRKVGLGMTAFLNGLPLANELHQGFHRLMYNILGFMALKTKRANADFMSSKQKPAGASSSSSSSSNSSSGKKKKKKKSKKSSSNED